MAIPRDESGDAADTLLVARSQAGDLDAYDELVMKYQANIAGLLFRFARQQADLEDLVQETFLRAWRALPRWEPRRPFSHWLRRIALRVGLEFCRRQQRNPLAQLGPVEADRPAPFNRLSAPADPALAAAEVGERAHFILAQLPPEERALLTLFYLEQMPLAVIAAQFGWSLSNAKVKTFRARQKLKTIVERHGYTFDF